jgi:glycosyltransferase involved in cell wall biosynthesis
MIATHDILVITSFVEGFPNVSLEALSVGIPVVSFKVSGISELIVEGFNGYAVEKDELKEFKNCLIKASVTGWNKKLIKEDVVNRYDIEPIVKMYEKLIGS